MTAKEFTTLFQENKMYIYNYCHKLVQNTGDAEDIMHDVFLNLWNSRHSINQETALNYLTTSARNKCYDFGRRKIITQKIFKRYVQEDIFDPYANELKYESSPEEIYSLIESLFPIQKQLIKLRYIDGYELGEIYKLLGKNRNTVRNQIFAGIANIRKKIKNRGIYLG